MTAPPAGALEACLALLEKATPERWGASGEDRVVMETLMFCGYVSPVLDECRYRGDIASIQSCNHIGPHGISREESAANADLIVAAVNLLKDHGPALLAALRLREWRPIESAPRDGSLFLGWVVAERWSAVDGGGSGRSADTSEVDFCQWRNMATGGFYENMMGQIGDAQDITHWMPLPAPPTADDLARVLEEGE